MADGEGNNVERRGCPEDEGQQKMGQRRCTLCWEELWDHYIESNIKLKLDSTHIQDDNSRNAHWIQRQPNLETELREETIMHANLRLRQGHCCHKPQAWHSLKGCVFFCVGQVQRGAWQCVQSTAGSQPLPAGLLLSGGVPHKSCEGRFGKRRYESSWGGRTEYGCLLSLSETSEFVSGLAVKSILHASC